MKGIFIELPALERHRDGYFDDDSLSQLQEVLMNHPEAGDLMQGTGGLRKLRFADRHRGKGKRGGLRVVYYYWTGGPEFWHRSILRERVKEELRVRRGP